MLGISAGWQALLIALTVSVARLRRQLRSSVQMELRKLSLPAIQVCQTSTLQVLGACRELWQRQHQGLVLGILGGTWSASLAHGLPEVTTTALKAGRQAAVCALPPQHFT